MGDGAPDREDLVVGVRSDDAGFGVLLATAASLVRALDRRATVPPLVTLIPSPRLASARHSSLLTRIIPELSRAFDDLKAEIEKSRASYRTVDDAHQGTMNNIQGRMQP